MKHCFIINPASGKETTKDGLESRIKEGCAARGAECFVYFTTGRGDAQRYIDEFCREHRDEDVRFYACGGDGTLCEVVNGVMALENRERVSVGVIPVGTGNDFVRNFSPKESFFDIDAQVCADAVDIDVIECNGFYAINMINIGFDSQVVVNTDKIKKKRWVPSKLAYICGLIVTLIKKPGVSIGISADGDDEQKKELLLTTFANGCFCGGGFNSNPHAQLCDGKINAMFVNDVTRLKFISLVSEYKNGTHLDGRFENILGETKKERFSLTFDKPTQMSVDGELVDTGARVDISCKKRALRFLVPKGTVCAALGKSSARDTEAVLA